MAEPLNYATQYTQALSQAYPNVLHFGALYARNQEGDYNWNGSKSIEVPTLSTTGRRDADRDTIGTKHRNYRNKWTTLTLRNHREWDTLVHPSDIRETNQVATIQNITKVFNEEQKFPEMDCYVASTVYSDWTDLAKVPFSGTLTKENVLSVIDAMSQEMDENNVPADGRILYVTPQVNTMIKNAVDFYRSLDVRGTAPASVQRAITRLDNISIEWIPTKFMHTAYDFTEGAEIGASAKQILMWLVHPSCIITPNVYEFARLDPPSAGSSGKWVYYEEAQEDVFILPNKEDAIEYFVAGLSLSAATFTTAAATGTGAVAGDCKITLTAPAAANLLAGSRYFYKEAASTAPDAPGYGEVMTGGEWIEWDGESTVNVTNGHKLTLVVASADARAYAVGNGTVTSKT